MSHLENLKKIGLSGQGNRNQYIVTHPYLYESKKVFIAIERLCYSIIEVFLFFTFHYTQCSDTVHYCWWACVCSHVFVSLHLSNCILIPKPIAVCSYSPFSCS